MSVRRPAACSTFLFAILLCGIKTSAFGQKSTSKIWRDVNEAQMTAAATNSAGSNRTVVPTVYRTLQLDRAVLESSLNSAPREFSIPMEISPELEVPMPDGGFARFHLQESPVMEPELAAKFPQIRTYVGQGIDDPAATIRIDLTPHGFHAMILSVDGVVYVDPYWRNSDLTYVSYFKKDYVAEKGFKCLTSGEGRQDPAAEAGAPEPNRPTGATLKRYRLALACTGEYAVAVNGPNPTVLGTLAAMVTSVNRCSGIYERDLAIRFLLVANNDKLVYLDGATDPYTNADGGTMLGQNQSNIDGVIGSANYDFGHVFSTGGGGIASLGVICTSSKAQGVTGTSNPIGDPYDVDYVVHEMGHQFRGNHTFNGTIKNCGGGNRASGTAYETDSGITIMAYAGICSTASVIQDLAAHSDDYFHTASYTEIDNFTTTGSGASCFSGIATGNTPPTIAALSAFTIPVSTPFALTASATDPDGDTLTYDWEEYDKGTSQTTAAPSATSTTAPIFRTFPPTRNPTRVFPSLTFILNNSNNPPDVVGGYATGEIMTTVARTMTYRVTVRDNRASGGGSNWNSTTVTTANAPAGGFAITSQNSAATIAGGSTQTITWNVASSNIAPVSCANVKISLSTDGGNTFPIVLANSVPNNGSASATISDISNVATTQGRIKVEAIGNIFFDISDANLTITSTNAPPTLNITNGLSLMRGTPTAAIANVATASSANAPLSVSVSDLPFGVAITPTISENTISLSGLANCRVVTDLTSRTYPITLTVTDSAGSMASSTVNILVQPNPAPTIGTYPAASVARGNSAAVSPSTAPADANNNLGAQPFSVTPTAVPGGGTVTIDQVSGVVTISTTNASTIASFTVRVSLSDTCGATVLREFTTNVTAPAAAITITSAAPPAQVIVGTPYTHTFTATGNPTPTFSLTSGALPLGLSLSANGVLSGTATSAGTGSFPNLAVTAANGVQTNATQTFSLSAVTRAANYLASFGLGGSNASLLADAELDGILNLVEYALHLNPTVSDTTALPVPLIRNYGGTRYLSMTFPRSSVATDLTYTVQASSDLLQWTDLATSSGGAVANGPGFVGETGSAPVWNVEVRDTTPASAGRRFLRLRVSTP